MSSLTASHTDCPKQEPPTATPRWSPICRPDRLPLPDWKKHGFVLCMLSDRTSLLTHPPPRILHIRLWYIQPSRLLPRASRLQQPVQKRHLPEVHSPARSGCWPSPKNDRHHRKPHNPPGLPGSLFSAPPLSHLPCLHLPNCQCCTPGCSFRLLRRLPRNNEYNRRYLHQRRLPPSAPEQYRFHCWTMARK